MINPKYFIGGLLCLAISICLVTPSYATFPLNEFVENVLNNNPAIQAAKSNVQSAKARERASGQPLYNPEFTAEVQNAVENTRDIGLNQTIDWANKRGAREKVGTGGVLIARAQLMELRQQLTAEILDALVKYQFEQHIVSLAKERTSLLQNFVSLTKKRYASGDVASVDLDLAQLALSEALALQADAEVSANLALQTLRATTGLNQKNWPHLSTSLPLLSSTNTDIDYLLRRLPSILVLNQQYMTARARVGVAEKERYPDPTIGVQWGRQYESGNNSKLIGATFTIPLFVRNTYSSEVEAANYDAIEVEGKRADLARQVRSAMKGSSERYQTLYRSIQQWQTTSGKPLSDGMTLIERLWQAGEINSTDYIVQLKQRIDSQIAGVALKERTWQAWVDWLKTSGQIENWLQERSLLSGEA